MHNHLVVKHPSSAAVAETESDGERPQLRKQPAIMQAFAGSSFSSDKTSRLTELIMEMLFINLCPGSIVERNGFSKIIDFLTGGKEGKYEERFKHVKCISVEC